MAKRFSIEGWRIQSQHGVSEEAPARGDDKQQAVYPPAGSSEMVTNETMVLFWGTARDD
jgi:hypothetical protein